MHAPLAYTGITLDRAHRLRRDREALRAAWADSRRRILPVWRNRHAVDAAYRPLCLPEAPDPAEAVFLGLAEGAMPWFAVDISAWDAPPPLGGGWHDLREIGPLVAPPDAALMAYARGILSWHRRHRFCGVCGRPARSEEGGHMRRCTDPACATSHFPRLDPAVIMLVIDRDDRALLGRQERFPPGMVSTLAGFVEPGETLEQAVAREVAEETSIRVRPESVRYVASQPWPFPSSLMLAFTAQADTTAITVDPTELSFARWFTREEVARFRETADAGDGFALPRKDSVARFLIERWLNGR